MHWLTVDGLAEHWSRGARRRRSLLSGEVDIDAEGVTDLTLSISPPASARSTCSRRSILIVDDQELKAPGPKSDRSWNVSLHRARGEWRLGKRPDAGLRKQHGLQGPIDDAFMDSLHLRPPDGQGLARAGRQMVGRPSWSGPSSTGGGTSAARRSVKDDTADHAATTSPPRTSSCGAIRAATPC